MSLPRTRRIKAIARGGNGGNCAEMRNGGVEVRDTKANGEGPVLGFTAAEFAAWLDGAERGEFDHLV